MTTTRPDRPNRLAAACRWAWVPITGALLLAAAVIALDDGQQASSGPEVTSAPSVPAVSTRVVEPVHRQPATARPGVPVTLSIPALGVEAPIDTTTEVPVVIDGKPKTSLAIPDNIDRVGWDDLTMRAGAQHGTTLISGHRDNAYGGLGALSSIKDLEHGDTVVITTASGDRLTYEVSRVETVPKDSLPAALVATTGPHRLALVTCGGRIVNGHWDSNVVVWARPV